MVSNCAFPTSIKHEPRETIGESTSAEDTYPVPTGRSGLTGVASTSTSLTVLVRLYFLPQRAVPRRYEYRCYRTCSHRPALKPGGGPDGCAGGGIQARRR